MYQQDEYDIECAKRTSFLENGEQFYEWTDIKTKYMNDIIKLYKILQSENEEVAFLRVYGELFGGDKDSKESKSKSVQKGIYYCPFIDFLVFDIVLTYKNNESLFLAHSEILKYMKQLEKLRAIPIIFRGSFTEAYNYCINNIEFKSTIPSLYGLDNANIDANHAEGYVMKPNKNFSRGHGPLRGVLKIKHPKFGEMIGLDKNKKKSFIPNEMKENLMTEIEEYITQNRLDNVISKYGPSLPRPKLVGMLINDAKIDYIKTLTSEKMKEFDKEWKNIFKRLVPQCNKLSFD